MKFSVGIAREASKMRLVDDYHWRLQIYWTGLCLCLDSVGFGSVFLAVWTRAVADLEDGEETEDLEVCSAPEPGQDLNLQDGQSD